MLLRGYKSPMNHSSANRQGARKQTCTAAVLAGGCNTRMNGISKAFIQVEGVKIIDRVLEVLGEFFDETIIISNAPLAFFQYDLPVYSDLLEPRSSLNGVYSALEYAQSSHVLVVPCDLPFLRPDMMRLLLDEFMPGLDVLIPQTAMGMEPLCAIYSKRCIKPARRLLDRKKFSIKGFFPEVRVKTIPESQLRLADPQLQSFFNVNSPDDLEKAENKEF